MSLLTICQDVARLVPVDVPTSIVGNSGETPQLLLACANQAGKEIAKRRNWAEMEVEHTFNTVVSQEDYDLPSDFRSILSPTVWDRANYENMRGPLSPGQWQQQKSSILANSNSTWKKYRIRNVSGVLKFSIFPTPDAVEACVFEYISNNWCSSSGGTGQEKFLLDTDIGIIDEDLIQLGTLYWFLRRMGLAYADEKTHYYHQIDVDGARSGGAGNISLSGSMDVKFIGRNNIPDTGYGA